MERPSVKKAQKYNRKLTLDKIIKYSFLVVTAITASVIVVSTIFIIWRGLKPFVYSYPEVGHRQSLGKFLFGKYVRDQNGYYAAGFIFVNTIYVTLIALIIAVPISIFSALYITKIGNKKIGSVIETIIEMLAAIPSIIYGLFGAVVITRLVKGIADIFNVQTSGGLSVLSTSLVLAIMIIPTLTMLTMAGIKQVDPDLELASLALGASPTQTHFKVVLRASKSAIIQAIIIATGRALGEATAVSMVAGNALTGPTFNPFGITRTLTTSMLQGIHESTGISYDIRFSYGILLMILILGVNILLQIVKNKLFATEDTKKKKKSKSKKGIAKDEKVKEA